MATPMQVQDALNRFLEENVAEYNHIRTLVRYQNKDTIALKKPKIVTGFIIPRSAKSTYENNESEDFPYIATRILSVSHKGTQAIISMKILFGAYCPGTEDAEGNLIDDASGYRDILNLMENTRIALFETKLIENICSVTNYYKQEIPEDQPYPYWEGWSIVELQASMPVSRTGF